MCLGRGACTGCVAIGETGLLVPWCWASEATPIVLFVMVAAFSRHVYHLPPLAVGRNRREACKASTE